MTGPTHKDGHTLDLIVTRCSDRILPAPPKVDCYLSDHASVCCKLASQRPPLLDKVIAFRKYKGIDLESFKRDLDSSSLCQSTPSVISGEGFDELARDYNNTLSALVDRHAPLKSKRVRSTLLRNSGEKLKDAGGGLGYTRILLLSKHKGIA